MGLFRTLLDFILDPSKQNRNALKGAWGEANIQFGAKLFLPAEYKRFTNVTLPTPKGTTQIDQLIVSPYGIHVIEVKNLQGDIYGDEAARTWTVFVGGKKHPFQNPLHQNRAHILALAAALSLPAEVFHSWVFFWSDNVRFRTPMPDRVVKDGFITHLKKHRETVFTPEEVLQMLAKLEAVRLPDTVETERQHVEQLRQRFHTAHAAGEDCPVCTEGKLVVRQKRDGSGSFLGCSTFPKCRHREAGVAES